MLAVSDTFGAALGWPRVSAFRLAAADEVRSQPLSEEERCDGIASRPQFAPFEKGDSSDTDEGHAIGARWWRHNPLVIDWSRQAVALLRQRSQAGGARKPYWRNKALWFSRAGEAKESSRPRARPGIAWPATAAAARFRTRRSPGTRHR